MCFARCIALQLFGVVITKLSITGGCSKIIPFIQHYFNSETLVLLMIDASQSHFLEEALDELDYMLNKDIGFLGVVFSKRDHGKCKENNLDEWARKVRDILGQYSQIPSELYDDLDQFSAFTGAQTNELLSRLALAVKTQVVKQKPVETMQPKQEKKKKKPLPSWLPKPLSKKELFEKIHEAAKNPNHQLSSNVFMQQMEMGDLGAWDHISHLRAGYICLHESLRKGNGVFVAAVSLLEKLDKMLNSKPDKFENTKHQCVQLVSCGKHTLTIEQDSDHILAPSHIH